MVDYQARKLALAAFGKQLKEPETREAIVAAYMADTSFTRENILYREVHLPATLVQNFGANNIYAQAFDVSPAERQPIGTVAVLLPKNSVGQVSGKSVFSSFYMGNRTIVKLPRQLSRISPIFEELIMANLPGVSIAPREESSASFLRRCILDPTIDAVVIYGDDRWIDQYKNLARRTGTKVIFEGPGNDPLVVFPDSDLESAVDGAIRCGLNNGGQSCSALERFYIHDSIYEAFSALLVEKLKAVKHGEPQEEGVTLGPIYSDKVLHKIQQQIKEAVNGGANLVLGGDIYRGRTTGMGIVSPTVLTDCVNEMTVVRDETFGPVFPLVRFGDDLQSLLLQVDDTRYGLNAAAYGSCPPEFADYLERSHKNVYYNSTASCPENGPSRIIDGGYKRSGFVWEWEGNNFIHREGKRLLLDELSLPLQAVKRISKKETALAV
ncbi:MAG: aldehyde dehydrogenase family protein [Bacteroidota bacterium]